MKTNEITQFRSEFKSIVYKKTEIIDNASYISSLEKFNKNGSHEKSILKALEQRKDLKKELTLMLKGYDYEVWKLTSKRLSVLTSKLKNANLAKEKSELEIDKLIFKL